MVSILSLFYFEFDRRKQQFKLLIYFPTDFSKLDRPRPRCTFVVPYLLLCIPNVPLLIATDSRAYNNASMAYDEKHSPIIFPKMTLIYLLFSLCRL